MPTITNKTVNSYLKEINDIRQISTNSKKLKPSPDKVCPTTAAVNHLKDFVSSLRTKYSESNDLMKILETLDVSLQSLPSSKSDVSGIIKLFSSGLDKVQSAILEGFKGVINSNGLGADDYRHLLKAIKLVILTLKDDLYDSSSGKLKDKLVLVPWFVTLNNDQIIKNDAVIKQIERTISDKFKSSYVSKPNDNYQIGNNIVADDGDNKNAITVSLELGGNANLKDTIERSNNTRNRVDSTVLDSNAIKPYGSREPNKNTKKKYTENNYEKTAINDVDDDISSVVAEPGNIKKTRKFLKFSINPRQWKIWRRISGSQIWNLSIFHPTQWKLFSRFRKNNKVLQNISNDHHPIMSNSIEVDTSTQHIKISIKKENDEMDVNKNSLLANHDNERTTSNNESNILVTTSNDIINGKISDDQRTPVDEDIYSSNNNCCSKFISGWTSWLSDYAAYLTGYQDTTQDDEVYESIQKEYVI